MDDKIETAAELNEGDVIPRIHEVHADPEACTEMNAVPVGMRRPVSDKSPARWAYERLILYINNFEKQLDSTQEVAMGFTGSDAGILRIEGMGYYDPDIVTFYGTDASGTKTQLIQHVSQLNVILRALPNPSSDGPASRIGFRLAAELEKD